MQKTLELYIPDYQMVPIEILKQWIAIAEAEKYNAIFVDIDWGYYDSIDGVTLRTEKLKKDMLEFHTEQYNNRMKNEVYKK